MLCSCTHMATVGVKGLRWIETLSVVTKDRKIIKKEDKKQTNVSAH